MVGGVGEDRFSKGKKSSFLKLLVASRSCRNKKKINYARVKNSSNYITRVKRIVVTTVYYVTRLKRIVETSI